MRKALSLVIFVVMAVAINGCGGSTSSTANVAGGGAAFSEFSATLPDGSPMEIEILDDTGTVWSGEFAVATETGPYAHQVGSFEGTSSNGELFATCEAVDGTEFTMTGKKSGSTLNLTRSDIPGVTLAFQPITPSPKRGNADVNFTFNTGSTNAKGVMSNSPYSIQAGGTMYEYRGSWNGLNVTYWYYTSGYGTVVFYIDPFCILTVNFNKLKIADFGSATLSSNSGQLVMYSSIIRQQVKFPGSGTLSP